MRLNRLEGNFQTTKDLYFPKHLCEMVQHLYGDDDMTQKCEIPAVQTAFSLEALSF